MRVDDARKQLEFPLFRCRERWVDGVTEVSNGWTGGQMDDVRGK